MSPEYAQAIIDGFKADGMCGALPWEIFGRQYTRPKWRIQSWLPTLDKSVSDALWDGNERAAFKRLLKIPCGTRDNLATNRYISRAKGEFGTSKEHGNQLLSSMPDDWKKSDWKTVKAVRSKGQHKKFRG